MLPNLEARRAELQAVVPEYIMIGKDRYDVVNVDGLTVLWQEDWYSGCNNDNCECPACPGETLDTPYTSWGVRFKCHKLGLYTHLSVSDNTPAKVLKLEIDNLSLGDVSIE